MKSIIQNRYKTELVENLPPPKKEDEKRGTVIHFI